MKKTIEIDTEGTKMRLPIVILLLVVSLCTAASADIMPPVTPVDIYAISNSAPARIATDNAGKIYVTDPYNGLVYIYTNSGGLSKTIRTVNYPIGIAVDSAGKIYVSDSKGNFVGAYSDSGDLLYKFGSGNQEFRFPNDIAIYEKEATRWAFVSDSKGNEIRKYSLDGTFLGSFGSDLLKFPTGITVDETAGELYVLDHNNVAVRIYDLNGTLKRSITAGGGMFGGGKLLRPLGIAVDSEYIYIVDAYHSVVAIYSKGGMYLKYFGAYGNEQGQFKIPSDVALDKDGKMFVTNTDNQRIEVLGSGNFTGLKIEPETLNFEVNGNGSVLTQSVNLSSIGTETSWTATTDASWILVSPGAGATPAAVDITVDPSGLSAGTYSTDVVFKTPSGTEYLLKVNAQVIYVAPAISVSPSSLNFKYQKRSESFPSETLMISANKPAMKWSARSSAGWLSVSKASGVAPDSIKVGLTPEVVRLRPGQYSAAVVVDAGSTVSGSPASINVSLEVMEAGNIKVKTNLDEAVFTITGTKTFLGSGREFTIENAAEGAYSITFGHVSGYRKPVSRSFRVETGKTAEIDAVYVRKPAATHLIAGSGSADGNTLRIISLHDGSVVSARPFQNASMVKVAAGDLDGDGIDEIVVTNGRNQIKVLRADGLELAERSLGHSSEKLEIAVADIDNDGKAEIIAGYIDRKDTEVDIYKMERNNRISRQSGLLSKKSSEPIALAAGDINGDGVADIVIADRHSLSAFSVVNGKGAVDLWTRTISHAVRPVLSAGDFNDDGSDELLVALGPDQNNSPFIKVLKGDGTDYGLEISALAGYNYKYGANTAIGIIEGEGTCGVAVGAGPGPENQAIVSFYNSGGQYLETIMAMDSFFGVNVSFGKLIK